MKNKIKFITITIIGLLINCKSSPEPDGGITTPIIIDASNQIVTGSCTLLEGVTQNKTILTICANIDEIATIASFVSQFLRKSDAGILKHNSDSCIILPETDICATKEELGPAIQLILKKRRSLLLKDN